MKSTFKLLWVTLFCALANGCMTNSKSYSADQGIFHVAEYGGNCKISFTSNNDYAVIDESTYRTFLVVTEDVDKRQCKEKIIMFSSRGGNVGAALRIGLAIKEKGYSTLLQLGEGCSSACGIIFIAGKERIALTSKTMPNSRIGFHQISRNKVCSEPSAPEYGVIEKYARSMLPSNAADGFVTLMKSTSCKTMSYVTASELQKMGIATKLQQHSWGI